MGSSVCDSSAPDANYLKMQGFVCYAQVSVGGLKSKNENQFYQAKSKN
jgi:hypothetical protein